MLSHVIPTLLLIGSLAAGITCFTWSGGPEPNSTVRPCPGSNVTLNWTFSLSDKDRLLSVQWFLVQASTTQKAVGFVSPSGTFLKVPDIKTRVEFLPPAGLRLYNVSTRDLGTYTVYVALFRPGGPDFRQRSVTLALPEKPYLSESRLVASLEPRTVTVNGTSHARLACGTILNHQDANFSVVWKTPAGQTVPSSGHQGGVFHLLLVNPVEGGAYHCHLHGVTSLTCQHNGTQSSAGRVEVDRLQTRLMVLEAGASRHDRQLLHANYESTDLATTLKRETNDSLEVTAVLDGLQVKTQSLDTVDTELRNLTAEHTQQLNAMDTELDNMKAEHKQQLNALDKRMDTVNTELCNLTAEHTQHLYTLDEWLNTVDTELRKLAAEHTQQLNTLDTELDNMKAETARQLNTLDKKLDTVDTKLSNLAVEHTQQLNTTDAELSNMKAEHTQQLNTLHKRLDAVDTEFSNAAAGYTQQLNTLDKRLNTVNTELSNIKVEQTRQINTLDKRLDTVNAELSSLAVEHTQQLNTFDKRLDTVDTKLGNVVSELGSLAARQEQGLDRVATKLRIVEEERHTLTADSREQGQQIQHLTAQIEQLSDTVSRQEQVIADLTALLEKLSNDDKASDAKQEELPRNCLEARQKYPHSGIQTIKVAGNSIQVYCDQTTDGGGWTLIQRRQDGSVDFYRDWRQYESGFGKLSSEFWLGLRNIHEMTTSGNYSLRVDLWDKSGNHVYAEYSSFYIGGPADNYRLHLGGYSGRAGDSMVNTGSGSHVANNMAFSTYDRDNDLYSGNCAPTWHGAWWYNSCQYSNLNGRYYVDGSVQIDGIRWYRYKNDDRSFTKTELKIKPVNN